MAKADGPKIVMVGGGSYNWCPGLLRDLMLAGELEGSEIVLLDPKLKAAEEVKAAGEAMAAAPGSVDPSRRSSAAAVDDTGMHSHSACSARNSRH